LLLTPRKALIDEWLNICSVTAICNYRKQRKFGVTKVWRIHHEVNKTSSGVVSWRMKVWQILSISQICQTLVVYVRRMR